MIRDWTTIAIATFLALMALVATAHADPMDKYEATSAQVWVGSPVPQVEYEWRHGLDDLEQTCRGSGRLIIACADCPNCDDPERDEGLGDRIAIDWHYWKNMDKYNRCVLHAHEWGHILGWDHDDHWFKWAERRAGRVCFVYVKPNTWQRLVPLQ